MIRQSVKEIAPGTWAISEFGLVNAFVAEGADRVALIDTGCGYGNIRAIVEELCPAKPITVLITHNHPDHIGGIYHFKADCPIYMNEKDKEIEVLGFKTDNAFRTFYVKSRGPVRCPGLEDEIYPLIPADDPDCTFESINVGDGDVLDVGGRTFKCLNTPGHSDGSICYLDVESGILFSGDTVNNSIILMRQPNNGTALIEKYNATLKKLWAVESEYKALAIGHDGDVIDKAIVHDYLTLTNGLLDGSITGCYEESGFRAGDVARYGRAELWYQCDK